MSHVSTSSRLVVRYASNPIFGDGSTYCLNTDEESFWFKYLGNTYKFSRLQGQNCLLCGGLVTTLEYPNSVHYLCDICDFSVIKAHRRERSTVCSGFTYSAILFVDLYDTTLPYLLAYESIARVT